MTNPHRNEPMSIAPDQSRLVGAPRLSRLAVERAAVMARLDEAASESLAVVHAPAGYGKTTLLIQWARRRAEVPGGGRVLWLTIDGSCDSRMTFWQAVLDLLDESGIAQDLDLPPIDPAPDISVALAGIVERIFRRIPEPVVLVLDAWESMHDSVVRDDLLGIIRHAHTVTVVLGTRRLDSELLSAASPHGVGLLSTDDLTFSAADFAALAQRADLALTRREVERGVEATGGWAFALRTILAATRDHLHFELHGLETLEALRARLVTEVRGLPGYPYLESAAVAESFTPELAEWLGADPADVDVLDLVEVRGLGARDSSPVPQFRLQRLLRDGILAEMTSEQRCHSHRRLALWHERNGQHAQGFFSALDAGDAALAVSFAQRAFISITVALQRNPEALTRQRRAFFAREPLLSLLNGVAHIIVGNTRQAMQRFATTIALSQARLVSRSGPPDPNQVWVQAALTVGMRLVGRYELVESSFRRFRRMLDATHDPHGILQDAHDLFTTESAVTLVYLDQLDEARALLDGEAELPDRGRRRHHYYPAGLAALVEALDGRLAESRAIAEAVEREGLPRQFDTSFYAVPLHLAHVHAFLEQQHFDDATARLEWCMLHWKTIEMWPLLLDVEVRAEWQRNGGRAAIRLLDERLEEKRAAPPISPAMTVMLDALRGELLVSSEALSDAHALAPVRRYRTSPRLAVPRALAFLVGGQHDRALGVADALVASERMPTRQRVELELIAASALLRLGDSSGAAARFAPAAELALESGLRLPFTMMLCGDARTLAAGTAHRRAIEEILDTLPAPFAAVGDGLPPLTAREKIVLARLATAETLPQIAEALSVSVNTVKSQARAVYRKLSVSGRDEAVAEARRRGLL